jgi:hypothetical protein
LFRSERVQEGRLSLCSEVLADKETGFRNDGRWYDQTCPCRDEPPHACCVMSVPSIGEGIQHTGVNDDHMLTLPAESVAQHLVSPVCAGGVSAAGACPRRVTPR